MILDLNALTVQSFETGAGAALQHRGSPSNEVVLCAAGGPTREVILCAVGGQTQEVILCAA